VRAAKDATGLVATPVAPRRCAWLAGLMPLLALSLLVCFVWVDQREIKWREKASYLLALSGEGNQRLERSFYWYDLLHVSC
jgi:hypothetical protein